MGKKRSLADANVDIAAPPIKSKKPKIVADETLDSTNIATADIIVAKKEKKKDKRSKSEKKARATTTEPEVVAEEQTIDAIFSEDLSRDPPEGHKQNKKKSKKHKESNTDPVPAEEHLDVETAEKSLKKKKSKKNKEPKSDSTPAEEAQPKVNGAAIALKVPDVLQTPLDIESTEKPKKKNKNKKNKEVETDVEEGQPEVKTDEPVSALTEEQEAPKPAKKLKKRRKKSKTSTTETVNGTTTAEQPVKEPEASQTQDKPTTRFICFIGNLPFSANADSIAKHFRSVEPASIRAPTNPETNKSKGYAFLEFDRYDRMKSCLASYHHSSFDDGITPTRRINVELTYVISCIFNVIANSIKGWRRWK